MFLTYKKFKDTLSIFNKAVIAFAVMGFISTASAGVAPIESLADDISSKAKTVSNQITNKIIVAQMPRSGINFEELKRKSAAAKAKRAADKKAGIVPKTRKSTGWKKPGNVPNTGQSSGNIRDTKKLFNDMRKKALIEAAKKKAKQAADLKKQEAKKAADLKKKEAKKAAALKKVRAIQFAGVKKAKLKKGANIALNTTVTMSSVYSAAFPAQNAVDGNENTFHHTKGSVANDWLAIDLGAESRIDYIRIVNRKDCCYTRLNNALVFVSDKPITKQNPGHKYDEIRTAQNVTEFAVNKTGRYVKIQLPAKNYLHVSELAVFGAHMTPAGRACKMVDNLEGAFKKKLNSKAAQNYDKIIRLKLELAKLEEASAKYNKFCNQ